MNVREHLILTAFAALCGCAQAQSTAPPPALDEPGEPLWEIGAAAGGGRVPDYPGSDQTHTRGIVLPIAIYRGPVLRIDQGGIRGRLLSTPQWQFELTATAAFNAKDNEARAGMPGLDYLFGVGPQWIYKGWQSPSGDGPSLHLKLRALMSTDLKRIDQRGVSFTPEFRWRLRPFGGSPTALTLSLEPTWTTGALQRYFYQVDPADARPGRPAYAARAGYLGTEAGATLSRRAGRSVSWFVTASVLSLHGAANTASPLLRDRSNVSVGAGVVWTPWHSEQRVRQSFAQALASM
ncbi:MAG TPA: MipA/OmpV family protein [Albitalea sp.]|nr:MipA/OmpV family protein [Albitalea sp.]